MEHLLNCNLCMIGKPPSFKIIRLLFSGFFKTTDFGVWTDNCKEICCKGLGQGKTYNKTRICAGSAVTHCKADNHGHNTTIAENCPIKCFDDECSKYCFLYVSNVSSNFVCKCP